MTDKIRILFLSASPWTMSRILVDAEAREIFERIHEGRYRDRFELYKHTAVRPGDLQRLLLTYQPHIVHISGHGSTRHKIVLGGTHGRGKSLDRQGLTDVFALHKNHVRLVLLNACFTKAQARSISEVIDYSIGTARPIGDKASVAFAGAFYRALGFGKSVRDAFESASAELALTKMPRSRGIELFVKNGISERDPFPQIDTDPRRTIDISLALKTKSFFEITTIKTIQQTVLLRCQEVRSARRRGSLMRRDHARLGELCWVTAAPCTVNTRRNEMPFNVQQQEMKNLIEKRESIFHKCNRKAPGTRMGTLIDWREGSTKLGKTSGRYGHALRDGR